MSSVNPQITDSVQTQAQDNGATIRLSTAQGLVYKAYKRPYGSGDSWVLSLYANGYYNDAPWEIFFTGVEGEPGTYRLMEKVPHIVYFIVTYYSAAYNSGVGLNDVGDTVTIVDGHGKHVVKVETLTE